jgi:hypothetical protein
MKNFFKRLLNNPTPVAPEQADGSPGSAGNSQPVLSIPATRAKREEIIRFIINGLKPYIDEKGHTIAGLRLYVVCNNKEGEETLQVALCADTPGMFQKEHLERKLVTARLLYNPGNHGVGSYTPRAGFCTAIFYRPPAGAGWQNGIPGI